MDHFSDALADGRRLRRLSIVYDLLGSRGRYFTSLLLGVSLEGERRANVRGFPGLVTVKYGPEFAGKTLDEWTCSQGLCLCFSKPGKLQRNANIKSFNARFGDECLNEHWFSSTRHARQVIEAWRQEYNDGMPKKSLGGLMSVAYAISIGWKSGKLPSDLKTSCY